MPGRSPHRRSSPPAHSSRNLSPHSRQRSPHHHHLEMPSSRGRERREYRTAVRKSRSPPLKRRSYSPPLKRKASPTSREKEFSRRRKISKSPVGTSASSSHAQFSGSGPNLDSHSAHSAGGSERFQEKNEFIKERVKELPVYKGPEEPIDYNIEDLKKFTIEIVRNPPSSVNDQSIVRAITNPEDIVPVRRPDEGSRPLFKRAEIAINSLKDQATDEHRRIISVDSSVVLGHERGVSREKSRHSPGFEDRYEDRQRIYYSERKDRSPYDSRHRSPPRHHEFVETRGKIRERRCSSREDLRREPDGKRREHKSYSLERRRSYERDSERRISEKRGDFHPRLEEREHTSRRYESERERDKHSRVYNSPSREKKSHLSRSHHSPPRDKRRAGSMERYRSRSNRGEMYEREREGGSDKRRRNSREREDRGRDRPEHRDDADRRNRPHSSKSDAESTQNSEVVEYIPPPMFGRGVPPIPRGIPPMMRARGIPRGIPRGFRPPPMMFPMGGMMPGIPRMPIPPFMPPMRGFPPRFYPPPF